MEIRERRALHKRNPWGRHCFVWRSLCWDPGLAVEMVSAADSYVTLPELHDGPGKMHPWEQGSIKHSKILEGDRCSPFDRVKKVAPLGRTNGDVTLEVVLVK